MKKEIKNKCKNSGVLFSAGMFIGIGVGLLTGEVAAYTMIGMGAGFAAMWYYGKK